MDVVPRCEIGSGIVVVVANDVAREFPIVSRIWDPRPIFVSLVLGADQTTAPTRISCHSPRTDEYGILTLQTAVGVISCLDSSAQQPPSSRVFTSWRGRGWLQRGSPGCQIECAC